MYLYTPINSLLIRCLLNNKEADKSGATNKIENKSSNEEYQEDTVELKNRSGCNKYIFIINEMLLMPCLIYK